MFKFFRKKILEGFIKDIIADLPKYKTNALLYFEQHKAEIIEKVIDFVKKEILTAITVFLFVCIAPVYAEDTANQEIVLEANKAVITVQKQPNDEKSTQKQDVKRNWFCVIIQVNGKVLDNTPNR